MSKGEQFLENGERLRELGQTMKALDAIHRSMQVFASEKNYSRFAHAIYSRAICWQHLYQMYGNDPGYAVLYAKDAEALLEFVFKKNITEEIGLAYYANAKAQMILDNYLKAVDLFKLALDHIDPSRAAQKADWLTNLGKALYLSGKEEEGLKAMLEGLDKLQKFGKDIDEYTIKVWISGAYMRLAETTKERKYLEEAKNLIESDNNQIMRKIQLANFITTGKTGL